MPVQAGIFGMQGNTPGENIYSFLIIACVRNPSTQPDYCIDINTVFLKFF